MTDRPFLFSSDMVLALLAGVKTQTRRLAKPRSRNSLLHPATWSDSYILDPGNRDWLLRDAAARPGDRAWVRETWRMVGDAPVSSLESTEDVEYFASANDLARSAMRAVRWKPSIHMPRLASRITRIVEDVRCERLTSISAADAIAEGLQEGPSGWGVHGLPQTWDKDPRGAYRALWEHLHGDGSWAVNPLVFVYVFAKGAAPRS